MAVVILVPPEAPMTILALPFSSIIILGVIEDKGLFPGTIKLAGDGSKPNKLVMPGDEKSSITLFIMIPVDNVVNPAPKLKKKLELITKKSALKPP